MSVDEDLKKRLIELQTQTRDPMRAVTSPTDFLLTDKWALYRVSYNTVCTSCSKAITHGDCIWLRLVGKDREHLHRMKPCEQRALTQVDEHAVELAQDWADNDVERANAALVVTRLGGIEALVNLTESDA